MDFVHFALTFALGFIAAKVHNLIDRERQLKILRRELRQKHEKEYKRLRSEVEDEMVIALGIGECFDLDQAKDIIRRLRSGKTVTYPPSYGGYRDPD